MTRVSFSAKKSAINVTLPKSWSELSQKELAGVYKIIVSCGGTTDDYGVKFRVFALLSGVRVERFDKKNDRAVLRFRIKGRARRCHVDIMQLVELLEPLDFIDTPGEMPVCLEKLCGREVAVDSQFHGLEFSKYLTIENRYQGYISSMKIEALLPVAEILYSGFRIGKHKPKDFEIYALTQWLVQIKAMFTDRFPNFYRPASGESGAPMLEVMNNQIRALTGGDVIKEAEVLGTDCWRALTELDYKAKEAEEYKRQMSKK